MEEEHVHDRGRERGKSNSISRCKKRAQIERAILLISLHIKMKVGIYNARDIVLLACSCEETIGEYGEGLGMVEVEPVCNRGDDVHDYPKADCHVGSRKPWAREGTAKVGRDGGPVQTDGTNAEAIEARAKLLGEDRVRENPAYPGEGGEHLEEVAGEDIVCEAAEEGDEEELVSSQAAQLPWFFLMECPEIEHD